MDNIIVVALKAIIMYEGKALIIKRSGDDDIDANMWEFAGGKLEFGEDLEKALKREIKEEVNLEVDIKKLLYAATFMSNEHRQVVIISYLCNAYNNRVTLSAEHTDFMWADRKQIISLLGKPILHDIEINSVWEQLNID